MSAFSHTVTLTHSGLSWLTAKLAKWPQIEVTSAPVTWTDDITGEETVVFKTAVSLNAPVVEGFTLNARIEHLDEGNIIYRCSGAEKPEYRTCKPFCQHCNTLRRRNDTFVLTENTTGRTIQVGRNCLADYCRSPEAAAYLLSWAADLDRILGACGEAEEGFSTGRAPETFSLAFVVSWSLAFGGKWVSASQARETGEQSTARLLLDWIAQLRAKNNERWLETREGQQVQATAAKAQELRDDPTSAVYATIEWIKSLTGDTDYENNLSVLGRLGYVTVKQWAFACSAHRAWLRAQHIARGEAEQKAREAAGPTGVHVGTVGERIGFPQANCTEVKSLGIGEFGERFLVKFLTPEGAELVWFTGPQDFEAGVCYDITGTVKDHSEYRGARSTVLSRVSKGLPKAKKPKKAKTA